MGYDLRITREATGGEISLTEWEATVASDAELVSDPDNAGGALWSRDSTSVGEPGLLYWIDGEVYSKHPDEPLVEKMVELADRLDAEVIGDDGERYPIDPDAPDDVAPRPWVESVMTPTGAMTLSLAGTAGVLIGMLWVSLHAGPRPPLLAAFLAIAGVPCSFIGLVLGAMCLFGPPEGRWKAVVAVVAPLVMFEVLVFHF